MKSLFKIFSVFVMAFLLSSFINKKSKQLPEQQPEEVQNQDTVKERWLPYINLRDYSKPFWKTDTITDETVQVIKNGNEITARLLFKAEKIIAVKAADFSKKFVRGTDWDFKDGQLVFGEKSTIPFFHKEDLVFAAPKPGNSFPGIVAGTNVLFSEGQLFRSKQIEVTYVKDKKDTWRGPVPAYAGSTLPNTIAKLIHHERLKVVFYGNSIEVGHNASGLQKVPPYMPTWPELVVYNLKHRYSPDITYVNKSIAGKLAKWGLDSVKQVVTEKPDLVVIGFGMNDGTARISPDKFRGQIKGIIDSVSARNPGSEFILIAPMLANPESSFSGLQASYKAELDKLKRKGVVVADLTGVHQELLKHKSYQDMTGNNINHPNDYLARWYAQYILGILVEGEK